MTGLGDKLRSQGRISARPGQCDALYDLAEKVDALVAERDENRERAERAEAELDELRIAIHGGCGCPAPYTECPHEEPLLLALNDARNRLTAITIAARAADLAAIHRAVDGMSLPLDMQAWRSGRLRALVLLRRLIDIGNQTLHTDYCGLSSDHTGACVPAIDTEDPNHDAL